MFVATFATHEYANAAINVGYPKIQAPCVKSNSLVNVRRSEHDVEDYLWLGSVVPFAMLVPALNCPRSIFRLRCDRGEMPVEQLKSDRNAHIVPSVQSTVHIHADGAIA